MAADNKTLGKFTLSGLPPAPRGVPQVEVSFDIDANGILNVKAQDKATGKEQKITIQSSSGLSEDEIKKMQEDAETHAEEDKKKKEEVEIGNNAANMVFSTEKLIKENKDKISSEDFASIDEKLKALKDLETSKDLEAIKAAMKELEDVVQKVSTEMYQKQAAASAEATAKQADADNSNQGTGSAEASQSEAKDETVEGDFEEVKEDK